MQCCHPGSTTPDMQVTGHGKVKPQIHQMNAKQKILCDSQLRAQLGNLVHWKKSVRRQRTDYTAVASFHDGARETANPLGQCSALIGRRKGLFPSATIKSHIPQVVQHRRPCIDLTPMTAVVAMRTIQPGSSSVALLTAKPPATERSCISREAHRLHGGERRARS